MKYNPQNHNRRSIRLKGYDYSTEGAYFITICSYQRECLFGAIANSAMLLNEFGEVVIDCWQAIPEHFPKIELDAFVVMPNHIHGILFITDSNKGALSPTNHGRIVSPTEHGKGMALPCPYKQEFGRPIAGSLPTIIGSFKSAVTKRINIARNSLGTPVWQRNYYEHIIRNQEALNILREYIANNPLSWEIDQLHPHNPSKW